MRPERNIALYTSFLYGVRLSLTVRGEVTDAFPLSSIDFSRTPSIQRTQLLTELSAGFIFAQPWLGDMASDLLSWYLAATTYIGYDCGLRHSTLSF